MKGRVKYQSKIYISFLKTTDKNCSRYGNHQVLPLPFRNKNATLPNKRCMAESRLERLKEKFLRDKKFLQDYKNFMDSLLRKGSATECSKDAKKQLIPGTFLIMVFTNMPQDVSALAQLWPEHCEQSEHQCSQGVWRVRCKPPPPPKNK